MEGDGATSQQKRCRVSTINHIHNFTRNILTHLEFTQPGDCTRNLSREGIVKLDTDSLSSNVATPCGLLKTDGDLTTEIGAAVTAAGSLEAGWKEGTRPNKRSPFMGLLRWRDERRYGGTESRAAGRSTVMSTISLGATHI